MMRVRPATPADADGMGQVHVRAWQEAYRGLMPDDYLDGLSAAQRAEHWRRGLERQRRGVVLLAEGPGVLGFVSAGPVDGEGDAGEVYAINVDPQHWGTGVGRALLEGAQRWLAAAGFGEAVLWVLPGNERARRFYERAGWAADGATRTVEVLGVDVAEVRYRRPLDAPAAP